MVAHGSQVRLRSIFSFCDLSIFSPSAICQYFAAQLSPSESSGRARVPRSPDVGGEELAPLPMGDAVFVASSQKG